MDQDKILERLGKLNPKWVKVIEKYINKIPAVRQELDGQTDTIMADMEASARPYKDDYVTYRSLPEKGVSKSEVTEMMADLAAREVDKWKKGFASGTVYHGEEKHINFLNEWHLMLACLLSPS